MSKNTKPVSQETESTTAKKPSFIEQARRAQIVGAAAAVVAEVGYARTSLARIADKANISKGVITYHFTSKDEILRMVATQFFERAWQHMEVAIEAEESALGRVRAWIGAQLAFYAAHRTEYLAMSDIMANHRSADGSHAYAADLEEEVSGLAEILAQGQERGEFRAFDTHSIANIILRATDGVLVAWDMNPNIDLEAQTDSLLSFIDHAIRKQPT